MKIQLPEKVAFIIKTIQDAGYEAYAVGGCVRDSILGRTPDDWDITTSAKPEQIKALFKRTVDTGLKHGTVTVLLERQGFEVTTYRIDGKYEDSRHPSQVIFTSDLLEDLKRRDFTINAMAYNEQTGLVDAFDGLKDLKEGVIRCVGNPRERFEEDALRIMRAVRFAAQLGYRIEKETEEAIRQLAPTLERISAERIQVELVKLLVSHYPDYLGMAWELGITAVILPEFDAAMGCEQKNRHHRYTVGEHTLRALAAAAPDRVLRLTMLLHDLGKPQALTFDKEGVAHFYGHEEISADIARRILRRLKFDNDTVYKVTKLVLYHDYGCDVDPDRRTVRRAIHKIGEDIFPLLPAVRRADLAAQSDYMRKEKEARLAAWEHCYEEILRLQECVSLRDLAVTGRDLIQAGMQPGRELGETLQRMLEAVLEDPARNTKEYLLGMIK